MSRPLRVSLLLLLLLSGCGESDTGPKRRVVEGTVQFQGTPLEFGSIRFLPQPEGPVSSAEINGGKFQTPSANAVPIGDLKVEISALPNTSGMTEEQILSATRKASVVIPEKYNQKTTLTAKVTEGSGPLKLDFKLD
ncbi:hypothetical protein [Planctomicrobium sp. SH527]|uniref:hypothetical protein n=1 Tax=Planctomicrobium sp. SH527 TaxID=3448123 RepID=UPI003F5C1788